MNPAAAAAAAGAALLVALALWDDAARPPPAGRMADAGPPVPLAARDVTPPGVLPGPAVDGPLTRLAVPGPPPPPARWHRFFRPRVIAAGRLQIGARSVRFAAIEGLEPEAVCDDGAGATWPCGRSALFDFRRLIRGRAVECYFSAAETGRNLTAPCRVAGTDLALWLVERGWARPAAGAALELTAAADAARCARRGQWRGAPRRESCR